MAQNRAGFVEDAKASFELGFGGGEGDAAEYCAAEGFPLERGTFRLETPYGGEMIVSGWIRAEQVEEEALRFERGIADRDLAAQSLNRAAEVVLLRGEV